MRVHTNHQNRHRKCVERGCEKVRYTLGRCACHLRQMPEEEKARLRAMSMTERNKEFDNIPITVPPFEWVGDEETLAKMFGGENQNV
jgi:hypothetical protein